MQPRLHPYRLPREPSTPRIAVWHKLERLGVAQLLGLDVLIRDLSMVCDDDETLAITGRLYDGLYEHRRRALTLGREPS